MLICMLACRNWISGNEHNGFTILQRLTESSFGALVFYFVNMSHIMSDYLLISLSIYWFDSSNLLFLFPGAYIWQKVFHQRDTSQRFHFSIISRSYLWFFMLVEHREYSLQFFGRAFTAWRARCLIYDNWFVC